MLALAHPLSPGILITLIFAAVIVLVLLTVQWKLQPFIALVIVSLALGLAAGMPPLEVTKSFQEGVGAVLGSITMIIALGAVIGKMLAQSGGAEVIARTIVRSFGEHRLHWAMALIAFVVGLPVFFAVGFVLLVPILFSISRESGKPFLLLGIPLLAGLATVHNLVPPHPGIMAAIGLVKADVGRTLFYSLLVGLPAALLIGPILGVWYGRAGVTSGEPARESRDGRRAGDLSPLRKEDQSLLTPAATGQGMTEQKGRNTISSRPTFGIALITILVPIALMLLSTLADLVWPAESSVRRWANFFGNATVALTLAGLVAFYTLGKRCGLDRKRILQLAEEALGPVASVLLIIGAGGGFSRVLVNSGVGDAITSITQTLVLPPLVLGWLIAAAMRIVSGSATVAITAAAGIMAPLTAASPELNREWMVLALGAGSLIFSHVNDGGFWLVKEFYGLTVPETFKTWSVLTTILSLSLLGLVLLFGR